ncbi:MAG: hypothetical protein AB9866_21625 [Syntrophobacteraceae bacterium]
MKRNRSLILMFVLMTFVLFGCMACAGYGKWSPTSQVKLDKFGVWADEWVGGALQQAPMVIAAASAFTGQTPEITMAMEAVQAAKSTLGAYKAIVKTGSGDPDTAQASVLAALAEVNKTIGQVQAMSN